MLNIYYYELLYNMNIFHVCGNFKYFYISYFSQNEGM